MQSSTRLSIFKSYRVESNPPTQGLSCSSNTCISMKSIPIRKDDEVQVDCYLLLRSCATNTMCAPFRSTRTTRCRSTVTFSFGDTPQVQHALHSDLQGRRGAGRLLPCPSELHHKYNVCSTRTTRRRSTATFSFGATPQIQCVLCKDDEVQVDCYVLLRSSATTTMCALQGR